MIILMDAVHALRLGDGTAGALGRWRINAGSPMILKVPQLRKNGPIRCIIDLASFLPPPGRIKALSNHKDTQVVGYWDSMSVSSAGIDGDLFMVQPKNEIEAAVLPEAVRNRVLIEAGVPMEVSIGAETSDGGSWDPVEPGKITLNAREYDIPDDDIPTFILRRGTAFESSIVTFGADAETGRIAAEKKANSEEPTMTDKPTLKAIIARYDEKRHALIARIYAEHEGRPETIEAAIRDGIRAADDADKDGQIEALKSEVAALKAKAEEYEKKNKEKEDDGEKAEGKAKAKAGGSQTGVRFVGSTGAGSGASPKTRLEAMQLTHSEDSTLAGRALLRATEAKFPDLFKGDD